MRRPRLKRVFAGEDVQSKPGTGSQAERLFPFTSHNLRLHDGTNTIPGRRLLEDEPIARAVLRTLHSFLPDATDKSYSIVDLGCLEGGYSALFAQAGFRVLGIEGRANNLERCALLRNRLGLEAQLRFICDDVHNLEQYGPFDVTFCSGLFYHLEDPVAVLEMIARSTTRLLILQTHYSTSSLPPLFPTLSDLTENEGVHGRWYPEFPETATNEERLSLRWASLNNSRSFWIEKRHLLQKLRDLGFPLIFEQYDALSNVVSDTYIEDNDRSLFVAVKPN